MAELVSDEACEKIEPRLPPEPAPSPKGGRPRVSQRSALTGIIFVLKCHRVLQMGSPALLVMALDMEES